MSDKKNDREINKKIGRELDRKIKLNTWNFIPPRERMKMLLMFASVVVLAGAMIAMVLFRSPPPSQADEETQPAESPVVYEDTTLDELDFEQSPHFSTDENDEFELYDPVILEEVVDNAVDADGRSIVCELGVILLRHWLNEKTQEQVRQEAQTNIFVSQLMENPAGHRGKIVYVDGVLERVGKYNPDDSMAIDMIYFGELNHIPAGASADDGGQKSQKVSFYLLDGPLGAQPGDNVELYGYFLQTRMNKQGEVMPVIVGKRFEPPAWLNDPESLAAAREGGFLREEKAVYYLLNKIMQMTPEQISQQVDPTITATSLRIEPLENRGKFVRFEGTVLRPMKQELPPNPTGLDHCYIGYLLDREHHTAFFYSVDKPEGVEEKEFAMFEGVFMKHFTYVSENNSERKAAVLIGRRVVPVEVEGPRLHTPIFILFAAAFTALAVAAFFDVRSTRRKMQEQRRKVFEKAPGNINIRAKDAIRKAKGTGN